MVFARMAWRIVRQTPPRLLFKFAYNFMWRNVVNMARFERRMAKGKPFFPAFTMISVTEACNLSCAGCWVTTRGPKQLSPKRLDGIINQCKKNGAYFFGLLGGEPLMMYHELMDVLRNHPDCYFQIFTNGTLLTDGVALRMKRMGNVTPLISVEGLETESDRRRGKDFVYARTMAGVRSCRKHGLIFGLATSVCRSNFDEMVSEEHVRRAVAEGAAYLWYYIYRPVGPNPQPENALTKEQIRTLRQFLVDQRCKAPIAIIDTYWDADGNALCPGAIGMSHHISPSGAVEFCPPLQMAKDFLNKEGTNLDSVYSHSEYLAALRDLTAKNGRGCILLDNPSLLASFCKEQEAYDTTSRGAVMREYRSMSPCPDHDMGEEAIPEKSRLYRWLKKNYFFGFGAYG